MRAAPPPSISGVLIITSPRRLPGRTSGLLARRLDALIVNRLGYGPAPASGRTVICTACQLEGGPFDEAEATHFVALHEELHHGVRRVPRQDDPGTEAGA